MMKQMNQLIPIGFSKWVYNLSGFNQYGLLVNDLFNEDLPDVKEAVRRLPPEIRDQRNFRIIRAMQLSACHRILPKEQWTKYEEDVHYLQPYLNRVVEERKEKEEWEAS
ncbi:cytochrome b-c1 complex subunit 7 [Monomorium pharaonis]|uniref:cytochrome b-c1 complex subunit 7 n=1 Tax=Monomorium pharaonis TaxID=307658 RepID=UPI00063EF6B9|nr:cytochrome b-c1 complex subunit 7 [Monomorium pharaonis]